MSKPLQHQHAFVAGPLSVPASAETPLATSPAAPTPLEVNHVMVALSFLLTVTDATQTTAVRLYRGASTGAPLVYTSPSLAGVVQPGADDAFTVKFAEDVSGSDFVQYTATLTQNGGAQVANGILLEVDVS